MEFIFTFQPESGYYLQTAKTRKWRAIGDKGILKLLENAEKEKSGEFGFRCFSMAPVSETAVSLWQDGRFRFDATSGHPRLSNFVKRNRDFSPSWQKDLYFVLGKEGRDFAYSCGRYQWHNLPVQLEERLQWWIGCDEEGRTEGGWMPGKRPVQVTFGVEDTWAILLSEGEIYCDLGDQYPSLRAFLDLRAKSSRPRKVQYIALNPFKSNQHFIARHGGTTHWKLPNAYYDEIRAMEPEIRETLDKDLPWGKLVSFGADIRLGSTMKTKEEEVSGSTSIPIGGIRSISNKQQHLQGGKDAAFGEPGETRASVSSPNEALAEPKTPPSGIEARRGQALQYETVEVPMQHETEEVLVGGSTTSILDNNLRSPTYKSEAVEQSRRLLQEHEEAHGGRGGVGWRSNI